MVTGRAPQQVAKRAIVLGVISFRSSLEVTDHPRVVEISQSMLPWLSDMGCDDELDPIERELLATPLGHLSNSQKADAQWAGEAAAFYCWMLNLAEPLDAATPADQSSLPSELSILRTEALETLRSASLREIAEIQDVCRHVVLVRSMLQEARVGLPASDVVRRHCAGQPTFKGFALSLTVAGEAEAQRLFAALADGGQVRMPMAKSFFSPQFGMVTDRFGVLWMVYVVS